MANLSVKARDITDPMEMTERIEYRNHRIRKLLKNQHFYTREYLASRLDMLASRNASDFKRLRELL